MYVDDLNEFQAYGAMGFGKFGLGAKDRANLSRVQFPKLILNPIKAWQYLTSIPRIGPFRSGEMGVPPGGLVLGGTFGIWKNEIVYEWRDSLPGDLPDAGQVLKELDAIWTQKRAEAGER